MSSINKCFIISYSELLPNTRARALIRRCPTSVTAYFHDKMKFQQHDKISHNGNVITLNIKAMKIIRHNRSGIYVGLGSKPRGARDDQKQRDFTTRLKCTYTALRLEETPSSIFKKVFRVLVNSFHDLCPVQTLNSLRVFNIA